ncbi:hypothetical protein [Chromobacterium sphagni]|uniref:Uncharacterized protein n=1 Tax=Chromobacterium sphagni TaxID=1903179 RepID=A0A1S1WW51_9NEIS|nr:hypothetical protein [Chromobacterium sphagni]OHX11386.1 hypothetical protein BI347_17070 [Chromobacterium sphagni]OHX18939.1 hypothetical protein BI344_09930 [Chromobacterium sphagni]
MSESSGGHSHGHAPHRPHSHQHLTPATLRAPLSLLAMSAGQRLALALLPLAALWLLVWWALQELA